MSVLNTAPLLNTSVNALNVDVPTTATVAWTYGAWTQVLASASGPISIAGLSLAAPSSSYSNAAFEVQVGTGSAGNESAIGMIKFYGSNSGNVDTPDIFMLPIPMGGINNGDRVSVRVRNAAVVSFNLRIALLYYVNITSDQVSTASTPWSAVPLANDGVTVTPNASAWVNSAWAQLTSGLSTSAAIVGLAHFASVAAIDFEVDIGTGSVGSETVITTLRHGWNGQTGMMTFLTLPVPYFVNASTPISVRLRKTGTNTTTVNFNLLYIAGVPSNQPNVGAPPVARKKIQPGVPTTLTAGTIYGLPSYACNIEFFANAASNLDVSVDGTTFFTTASLAGAGNTVAFDVSAIYVRPTTDVTVILRKKGRFLL